MGAKTSGGSVDGFNTFELRYPFSSTGYTVRMWNVSGASQRKSETINFHTTIKLEHFALTK